MSKLRLSCLLSPLLAVAVFPTPALPNSIPGVSGVIRGDLNRDGTADLSDIPACVLAHQDPAEWMRQYSADEAALLALADFSEDGRIGSEDIPGFAETIGLPIERLYLERARAAQAARDTAGLVTGLPWALRLPPTPCPPVPPPGMDLHIDGDNNNGFGVPNRSAAEQALEPPTLATGKLLALHEGAKRVPAILELAPTASVQYGEELIWYLQYHSTVRLWRHPVTGTWPTDGFVSAVQGSPPPTYSHRWWYHGDMNGDGCIGTSDIGPFVMALTYPNDYRAQYVDVEPFVPFPAAGDFDGSLSCTVGDIAGFNVVITGAIQRPAPVYLWIEALGPGSSNRGDAVVTAYGDTDDDGGFWPDDPNEALYDQIQCTIHVDIGEPRAWAGSIELNRFSTVDLRTGNVFTQIPIASSKGTGPPITFSVFHNSFESGVATEWNPFCRSIAEGPHVRWSHSAHIEGIDGDNLVTVVYDDGRTDLFRRNTNPSQSGRYYDPPAGVYSDLRWDANFKEHLNDAILGAWVLTARDQSKQYFTSSTCGSLHELVRTVDAAGNPMRMWLYPVPSDYPEHKIQGTTLLRQPLEQQPYTQAPDCGFGGPLGNELTLWFKVLEGEPCTTKETATDCPGMLRYPQRLIVHSGRWGLFGCDGCYDQWFVEYHNDVGQSELWIDAAWGNWNPSGGSQPIIFAFDDFGRIETVTDMDGRTWSYAYDSLGRLYSITDPGNGFQQFFTYVRNSTGTSQVQVTDRRGYSWTYGVDVAGNLTSITTPMPSPNNIRLFGYDTQHNVTSVSDELNHAWTFTYTPLGSIATVTSPLTGSDAQTWTFANSLVSGGLWNFERLDRVTDPLADWTELLYIWDGYTPPDPTAPAAIRDNMAAAGQATKLLYWDTSHGSSCATPTEENPENHSIRGLLREVQDMNNGRHLFKYNARGFLRREDGGVRPGGGRGEDEPTPFNGTEQHDGRGWPERQSNDNARQGSAMQYTPNGGMSNGGAPGCKVSPATHGGREITYPFAARLGTAPAPLHEPPRICFVTNKFDAIDRLIESNSDYCKETYGGPANDWDEHLYGLKDITYRDDYFGYETALGRILTFRRTLNDNHFGNGDILLDRQFTFYYNQTGLGEPKEVAPTRITGPDLAIREYRRLNGQLGFDPLGRPLIVEHGSASLGEAVVKYTYDAAGRLTREDFGDAASAGAIVRTYDNADRLTLIEHLNGSDQLLLSISYAWRRDNTVQSRTETDYIASRTSVVSFEYDGRKQLTREYRTENSEPVYDIRYTYDPVGNRLTKHDLISHYKTLYFYDVDDDRTVPSDPRGSFTLDYNLATADNRLIYYKEYDADGAVLLRTVTYTYYKIGHASNITIKDEGDPWYYNLNLYYFSNGQLWRALWDKWKLVGGLVDDYTVLDNNNTDPNAQYYPREFYYDGNGARRLTRRMTVDLICCLDPIDQGQTCSPASRRVVCPPTYLDDPGELPMTFDWKVARNGTFKHDFGTDMLGLIPWSEYQAHLDDVNGDGDDDEDRIFPIAGYLSDGRIQSRLPAGGTPEYLHGDLTHSTMLRTNPVGGAILGTGGPGGGGAAILGHTAFGEPVIRNGGAGTPPSIGGRLPAAMPRYGYVGGLGYEQDTMVLPGSTASPLPPITLSHVGRRWYQPVTGCWVQRDPIGLEGGLNVYSYARGNPIPAVDPSGEMTMAEVNFVMQGYALRIVATVDMYGDAIAITTAGLIAAMDYGLNYYDSKHDNHVVYDPKTGTYVSWDENDDGSARLIHCMQERGKRLKPPRWLPPTKSPPWRIR